MMLSRNAFLFLFLHNAPGSVTQRFHCMDGSPSPNAPYLGTLLYPIPDISDAPALLVYPHVSNCSFRLSRRLTETGGWFYVLKVALRGSACGSGLWQHCPVPPPLSCQCFTYFGARHLARHYGTCIVLHCCPLAVSRTPILSMALYNLKMCHLVLQVHNKRLGVAVLPYSKCARA